MSQITIHNFPRGARGLRVAWQCEEMGLDYRCESVTYPPSPQYLALNPLGSVPFLQDQGGVAINESVAMMLYLAQAYGPTPLLPTAEAALRARVLQMTIFGEASLGAALNPLLAAHFAAPADDKRNWSVRGQEDRMARNLDYVAHILAGAPFLAGDDLTLADISVSTALGMWRGALGKSLPGSLATYQDRIAARPAYQRAQAKSQE